MIAAIVLAAIIVLIIWLITVIVTQAMLPCDKCPLRGQCKQLEKNGYPNICTQQMLNSNYGERI